jgi:membrane protease YdiL (CAAX protease family)
VRGSAHPSARPALVAYAAAFVLTLATNLALLLCVAAARSRGPWAAVLDEAQRFALSAGGLMAQAAASAGVFALVAWAGARIESADVVGRLRIGAARSSTLGVAAAIAGMVGLSIACGATSELLGVRGRGVMEAIARELRAPTATRFVVAVFALGLAPGLAEEALFRGLLQGRMVAAWGRVPGIVGASLAFGLIHGELVQGTVAFLAGLFLGWTAERLGGIRPTMLAHAVNNALFVALAAVHSTDVPSPRVQAAAAVAGAALWLASTVALSSPFALRPAEGINAREAPSDGA